MKWPGSPIRGASFSQGENPKNKVNGDIKLNSLHRVMQAALSMGIVRDI
jgi:hypothetical protein